MKSFPEKISVQSVLAPVFAVAVFILAFWVYSPGLSGGFLFDDYPNLSPLGHYGQVGDWDSAKAFVTSGFSGPTGRPIALASFLLDDNTWPSHAPWFKRTNVYIHLICGLLLCWAVLLLMRNQKVINEQQAQWVAILATALWLLHPYMLSTVLYVVQRMAQLAALFSLVGIVTYLHGRLLVSVNPYRAYILMSAGVGMGTILATYSKENGVLLTLLILMIEFCLPDDKNKPIWQWRALFLWLPSLGVVFLLMRYINLSDHPWANRNFNQVERLLTEGRIVLEYIYHLVVPRIEGNGLYQDGFIISKSFFRPVSTIISLFFLSFLVVLALMVRRGHPWIALAILFFFSAHLLESTLIGLELYFEHRNYLAALFLFLPLSYYGVSLAKKTFLAPLAVVVIMLLLAGMTYLRSGLWGDSEKLELYWAQSAENSPRAQNSLISHYLENGNAQYALEFAEAASERLSDSSFLSVRVLMLKVSEEVATEKDFQETAKKMGLQNFETQTAMGIRVLTENIIDSGNRQFAQYMLDFIRRVKKNGRYNRSSVFERLMPYLQARLQLMLGNVDAALPLYAEAVNKYGNTSSALAMVAELGSSGYYEQALQILDQAEIVFQNESDKTLDRGRESYRQEFAYLRQTLNDDLLNKSTEPKNENIHSAPRQE